MNALIDSQVFFFISSLGFIILGILSIIILVQIIRAMHTFSEIMEKIERDIDDIGDTTREFLDDLRTSPIFRFFFKGSSAARRKRQSAHHAKPTVHIDIEK